MKPYISIIVPTTRVGGLDILFSGLEQQTFKDFELLLVDSLFEYRKELVQTQATKYSFPVKHFSQPNTATDLCKAMNKALIHAEGHLVYLLCDYTWLDKNCLQIHADFHKSKKSEKNYAVIGHFNDCQLPILHKDFYRTYASNVPYYPEEIPNLFVIKERENYNHYIEDINSGKLNELMWSLFETPFTTSTNQTSFIVNGGKAKLPAGIVDGRVCIFKNESYLLDTVLDMNGFNEELDGSHGWQDWEFGDRIMATTNAQLFHLPEAIAFTINPRTILYARDRRKDVFSNEKVWKDGVASKFAKPVNSWSIKEERNKKSSKLEIKSPIIHNKKPYLSIVCPTMRIGGLDVIFNSLDRQTFKNFELIISDSLYNYRKDIVKEKADKLSFKYKHIPPIIDKFPISSICHATNSAIVQAEGDVIVFVTDYRYFPPEALQKHVDFHQSHADNIGYAPPSKFLLPPPMKKGIPSYGRNAKYKQYMEDLKNGALQNYMWSIYDNDIFETSQDLSDWPEIDRLKVGYDPKTTVTPGEEVSPQHIYLQSESVKTKIVLEANGMNEALDGAFNYMDIEFSHRLRNMFDFKWLGDNTNPVYRITGGDGIINKPQLLENVQNTTESVFNKYRDGSKEPVNTWSLTKVRAENLQFSNQIMDTSNIIETSKIIRENTIDYFGRSFKAVDWHLIPGNNGQDDPWVDEMSIKQKYWNSFTPGQVIIDIGACFGLYTLPALMQGCRVIAFEPNAEYSKIMTESVIMNHFTGHYQVHNIGLWNGTTYPEELATPALQWCKKEGPFETTTLNEVTRYLDRVDMIKIDVEGAEAGVLEGAHDTIKRHKPSFLIEDHTGLFNYPDAHNTRAAILSVLTQYNYTITVDLFGGPPPPGGGRFFIIATPK